MVETPTTVLSRTQCVSTTFSKKLTSTWQFLSLERAITRATLEMASTQDNCSVCHTAFFKKQNYVPGVN